MGNIFGKKSATAKGNAHNSLTNDGRENSGGRAKKEECEASTMEGGGATSSEIHVEGNTKEEHMKGKKSSSDVVIKNNTNKVMLLKEKVRVANGPVRYRIEAGDSTVIKVGPQSTYYRLLVYTVEVEGSSTEDTGLTIDSDMLTDAKRIIFCKNDAGKYEFQ